MRSKIIGYLIAPGTIGKSVSHQFSDYTVVCRCCETQDFIKGTFFFIDEVEHEVATKLGWRQSLNDYGRGYIVLSEDWYWYCPACNPAVVKGKP